MARSFTNSPPKTESSKKTKKPTRSTMYRFDIPSLPNVANPAARASLTNAPVVVANTPLNNGLLLQAVAEHRAREAAIFSATVTPEEVLDANKRMLAVLSEHVIHDYPGALLPSNAVLAAVYNVVAQAMNTVNLTLLAMDRRMLAMDDRILAMDRRMLAMDRQFTIRFDDLDGRLDVLDNASRQAHNARIEERTKNDPWAGRLQLRSYLRVNPAYGPGFPGGPAIAARRVDMGDEYPSPPFLPTIQALSTIEARDIMELSILMDRAWRPRRHSSKQSEDLPVLRHEVNSALARGNPSRSCTSVRCVCISDASFLVVY